jgi:hypothetical protein
MLFRVIRRSAVFVALTASAGAASAAQVSEALDSCTGPVEFDGRFYELVIQNGVSWDFAQTAAQKRELNGVKGHLATITSAGEDAFLEWLRGCALPKTSPQEVWVGGYQDACEEQPACGWKWINGEGPISALPDFGLPSYSNWLPGEPNNLGEKEKHLGIGLGGGFGWNDEGNLNNIGGYIIEYDTSNDINVLECLPSGDPSRPLGCQTTSGQRLELPAGVNPDGRIGIRTYEFLDPRVAAGTCGKEPLTLFQERGPTQELRFPAYLCGSPRLLVVEITSESFRVLQGTVRVDHEPIEALPGNWYECQGLAEGQAGLDPVPPGRLMAGDPQARDVVLWQSRNPANMRENGPLAGSIDPAFVGAVGEYTVECGSSRGLTRAASYFVIGAHKNFGLDFSTQPEAVAGEFVRLTRYKLALLEDSVRDSRPWLTNGDFVFLRTHLNNAIWFHDRGQYASALKSIELFLERAIAADYQTNPRGINYDGENIARASNIAYLYRDKVIPLLQ